MIRRLIAPIVITAVLLAGGFGLAQNEPHGGGTDVPLLDRAADVLGTEAADAHHTHSPTTLCAAFRPAGTTMLTPHSHYYSNGHPSKAHCYYRNNTTFQVSQKCIWYGNHAVTSLSLCAH